MLIIHKPTKVQKMQNNEEQKTNFAKDGLEPGWPILKQ